MLEGFGNVDCSDNPPFQSVAVTADHGLSVIKTYSPLNLPGMIGS